MNRTLAREWATQRYLQEEVGDLPPTPEQVARARANAENPEDSALGSDILSRNILRIRRELAEPSPGYSVIVTPDILLLAATYLPEVVPDLLQELSEQESVDELTELIPVMRAVADKLFEQNRLDVVDRLIELEDGLFFWFGQDTQEDQYEVLREALLDRTWLLHRAQDSAPHEIYQLYLRDIQGLSEPGL